MSISQDILSNIDIVDVISRYVNLRKAGRNFIGLCPFHREKTPSFTVAPDKQIYKCFGCGAGGNAIKFVMEMEKLEYRETIKLLSKDAGIDISKYEFQDTKEKASVTQKEKIKLMNKKSNQFFSDNFQKSDTAKDYVSQKRKLTDAVVQKFEIGFAPSSNYDLVNHLKSNGFTDDDILQAGLGARGKSGDVHSFFRNRIVFPIYDHISNLVAFSGRAINADDMPKYLNTPETSIYDKSKVLYGLNIAKNYINEFNCIFLVEGYMDVIGFYRAGLPIAVASCGTSLTINHIKLAKRYTPNMILAFDNDEAGFTATVRAIKLFYEMDIYPNVFALDRKYKDFDEYVNALNLQTDEFKKENLESVKDFIKDGFDFILDRLCQKYDANSPAGRKLLFNDIFEILLSVQDLSILMLYFEKVSQKLGINESIISNQFKVFKKDKVKYQRNNKDEKESEDKTIYFYAIFYDKFLSKNNVDLSDYVDFFEFVSSIGGDEELQKIVEGKIDENIKEKIFEAQLWREKEFSTLDDDKKAKILKDFIKMHKFIDVYSQKILKSKDIDADTKNNLISYIQKLRKN